jgi:hypothetical protein
MQVSDHRRDRGRRPMGAAWLALLLAVAVPRLLAPLLPASLDAAPVAAQGIASPIERPGLGFPGSAFFFAEGAFDPAPGVAAARGPHLLGLDSGPPAPSAVFRGLTPLDSFRAANCLTAALYYEAANEPDEGQRAIAQVILNRVRNPAWPHSVCGVVYQGIARTDGRCQFSFACDGAAMRPPMTAGWIRARRVAVAALAGRVYAPVGMATHYHTLAVRPDWAATLRPVAAVGAHIFYRPQGTAGLPEAFPMRYSGREMLPMPSIVGAAGAAPVVPPPPVPAPSLPARLPPEDSAPAARPGRDADLPESTIRPEYRNSGRPLI